MYIPDGLLCNQTTRVGGLICTSIAITQANDLAEMGEVSNGRR